MHPNPESFGSVTLAQTQTKTFTLRDTGDLPLNLGQASVDGANSADFALEADEDACSGVTLAAGASCTLQVQFSPSATGAEQASLEIPSNSATGANTTVPLAGTGVATTAGVTLTPTPENFGHALVGNSTSDTFTLTDTGSGNAPVLVGQAKLTGKNADQFAFGADNCSGQSLTDGQSCTITVSFAPTADGTQVAGLAVPSTATGGTVTAGFQGTGDNPPSITLSPSGTEDFGAAADNLTQEKMFVIYNTGDAPLSVSQAVIGGPDAGQFAIVGDQDFCSGQSVPGGGSCILTVRYSPAGQSPVSATLTVASDASNNPSATVNLTGTGAPANPGPSGPQGPRAIPEPRGTRVTPERPARRGHAERRASPRRASRRPSARWRCARTRSIRASAAVR